MKKNPTISNPGVLARKPITLAHNCHVKDILQAPSMNAAVDPAEPKPMLYRFVSWCFLLCNGRSLCYLRETDECCNFSWMEAERTCFFVNICPIREKPEDMPIIQYPSSMFEFSSNPYRIKSKHDLANTGSTMSITAAGLRLSY